MPTKKKTPTFEALFKEFEALVERFEQGKITLEEGITEFDRGLELAEQLKKRLRNAENKIIEVQKKFEEEN